MSYRGYSSKEEWEQNKWYLVRQMFHDPPILSPIQEENEPREPPDSLDNLPELIIEVIPRRPNADETKEFYKKLEQEVRDFLNLSREDYRSESFDKGQSTVDADILERSALTEDHNTFTAYVIPSENNVESSDDTAQQSQSRSYSSSKSYDLADNEDASTRDKDEYLKSPEAMRLERRISMFDASDIYKYTSKDSSVSSRPSSLSFEASEDSSLSSVLSKSFTKPFLSSTPIQSSGQKRKSTDSDSFYRKKSKSIQTSVSDTSKNDIWKNFFVGKQIVYKLCSCNDHVCM